MSKNDNENNVIKMIILGDSGVGKTCLVNGFDNGLFTEKTISTYASAYISKIKKIGKIEYNIQLWDTPGQEKYRAVTKLFYREAKICIVVYDITQRSTFQSLDYWIESIKESLGNEPIIAIVGNKIDLFEKEEINEKEGKQYSQKIGALFYLSSAKSNIAGFSEFIEDLINKYFEKNNLDGFKSRKSITLKKNSNRKSKKNCQCLIFNEY